MPRARSSAARGATRGGAGRAHPMHRPHRARCATTAPCHHTRENRTGAAVYRFNLDTAYRAGRGERGLLARAAPAAGRRRRGTAVHRRRTCRGDAAQSMASVTAVNRPGVLIVAAVALASMAATVLPWPTVMFYNPSSSAPRGWYLRRPLHHLRPGSTEEHTSELQSLMRISYAVFCL